MGRGPTLDNHTELDWIDFYQELADKVVSFEADRPGFISKIGSIYDEAGMKLPKLDSVSPPSDIDPFTFFGLFNKGINATNRIRLLSAIREEFGVDAVVPGNFDGIPALNNLNATFYYFVGNPSRGNHDIDWLWEVFRAALAFASSGSGDDRSRFEGAFDKAREVKGNRFKLTMGLYWIRPHTYLNLDSRNRWFIGERCGMPKALSDEIKNLSELPSASEYMTLCEAVREAIKSGEHGFSSFPELSKVAWDDSEAVNKEKKALGKAAHGDVVTDPILADADVRPVHYWLYSPGKNACIWDDLYKRQAMAIGWGVLGDLSQYESKTAVKDAMRGAYDSAKAYTNDANCVWQFVHEMRPGDVVFAKRGMSELVGCGTVSGDYAVWPRDELLVGPDGTEYPNARGMRWANRGSWPYPGKAPMKTITDITSYTDLVSQLSALFVDEDAEPDEDVPSFPLYTKDDFLSEAFMDEAAYDDLEYLVRHKKNVVLQGAPGVGKTYCAKRLAYSMMGEKDPSRACMVQFHQSYSYEDFIQGFRPTADGFVLKDGAFYTFCKKAGEDSDNDYFFIIDEINRGNLSKILGELFMLIEADKRGVELRLLYFDEVFSVPENVYIIGTMNTADRSIALLDFALRRRFSFFGLRPGFGSQAFHEYAGGLESEAFNQLAACLRSLNEAIASDESLGEGFVIGHSYLCGLTPETATIDCLRRIVEYELMPLLREYWFDDPATVGEWEKRLMKALS